jgi:hypothetical protein
MDVYFFWWCCKWGIFQGHMWLPEGIHTCPCDGLRQVSQQLFNYYKYIHTYIYIYIHCFRLSQERPEFTFQQTECRILGTSAELAIRWRWPLDLNWNGTCRQAPCLILSCALEPSECKKTKMFAAICICTYKFCLTHNVLYIYIYINTRIILAVTEL